MKWEGLAKDHWFPKKPYVSRPGPSTTKAHQGGLFAGLSKSEKLNKIKDNLSPGSFNQLISTGLKPQIQDAVAKGLSKIPLKTTTGPTMYLDVPGASASGTFSVTKDMMKTAKEHLNLSLREQFKLRSVLKASGAKVEKYLHEKLAKENHVLDDFFTVEEISFICQERSKNPDDEFLQHSLASTLEEESTAEQQSGDGPRMNKRHVVYCNDNINLIGFLQAKRQIEEDNASLKIGIDGGMYVSGVNILPLDPLGPKIYSEILKLFIYRRGFPESGHDHSGDQSKSNIISNEEEV